MSKLPPGWTFTFYRNINNPSKHYRVSRKGQPMFDIAIDSLVPLTAHIRYIWAREAEALGETKVGAGVR